MTDKKKMELTIATLHKEVAKYKPVSWEQLTVVPDCPTFDAGFFYIPAIF